MSAHILSYGEWWLEGPREATIAFGMWIFGLVCGAALAHKHIVKPSKERHEEVMDAHKKVHRSLGIDKDA